MKPQTAIILLALIGSTSSLANDVAPRTKRWKSESFTFELANTEPFIKTKDVETALEAAAATWNDVGAGTEVKLETAHGQDDAGESIALDGVNRVSVYRGEWPYPAQAGAVTVAWTRPGDDEIVEADLALNPAFQWTLDHGETSGLYDLKNVLTHEMGHSLGLPDIKDPRDATMFFLILPGETLKRDLSDEDTRMLLELYEHIDDAARPGCSTTGKDTTGLGVLALAALFVARRNRRFM